MSISKSLLSDIIKHLKNLESIIVYRDIDSGNEKRKIKLTIRKLEKQKNLMDIEKTLHSSKKELEVLDSEYYRARCKQLTRQVTALERLLKEKIELINNEYYHVSYDGMTHTTKYNEVLLGFMQQNGELFRISTMSQVLRESTQKEIAIFKNVTAERINKERE